MWRVVTLSRVPCGRRETAVSTAVVLTRAPVVVRRLRRADEAQWLRLRRESKDWLRPWEATVPPGRPDATITFAAFVRQERKWWRQQRAFPMVIEVDGDVVGRVSIGSIQWGAECGASVGYWIRESHAGRGIVPTAVALLSTYAFEQGLHRLEIAVRPDNASSVRVAQKLGFRDEGLRRRYLCIDGQWRDHQVFALTADEVRTGPLWAPGS